MKHVLIVGRKISTLRDYLNENGYEYSFLHDVRIAKFPERKLKRRVVTDFSSKESVLRAVDMLKQRPDTLITTYENYVLPSAWIAEYLGIPGMPVAAAEACTDKSLMRSLFAGAPEKISPDFAEVANEAELLQFASTHTFPLILKPANLAKSLLVTKNNDQKELLANYREALELINGIYAKYAPNRHPKLIIEEFLDGSIHSVDAFVDSTGHPHVLEQIVDYETGYDIGHEDNFHYSRNLPSTLSVADQQALRHCASVGIQALGMKSSPAHVEVIMTTQGPRIVEIGARNGGYRERMHRLANGIDITANAIKVSLGEMPSITATKNDPCAVLELFPKKDGAFHSIAHLDELKRLPSLTYVSVKAAPGDTVGKASSGHKACAIIILHNSDGEQFAKDYAFVRENVVVTLA